MILLREDLIRMENEWSLEQSGKYCKDYMVAEGNILWYNPYDNTRVKRSCLH